MTASGAARVIVADPVATLSTMGRALRERGVPVGPDRLAEAVAAIALLGADDLHAVYWACRASLCSDPAHIEIFDEVFSARGRPGAPSAGAGTFTPVPSSGNDTREHPRRAGDDGTRDGAGSRLEQLRRGHLTALADAERAEILELIAAFRPRVERPARRRRSGGQSRVDVDRTVESMLRNGGEIIAIARDRRRTKPRRLVILIDISRSIEEYTEFLLHFGYAAVRAAPNTTEVFTLGTQLTRLTRQLRHRAPEHALAAAGSVIQDWHGGTRLGTGVAAFLDSWGRRGTARGAVVVICSDGQTTDADRLGVEAERLARIAHTVIWANPCVGQLKYQPFEAGLRAVEAHVSAFVPAGSFGALIELAALVTSADSGWARATSG